MRAETALEGIVGHGLMCRRLREGEVAYSERSALGVNDAMRAETPLKGIVGKRPMYRRPDEAEVA